MRGNEILSLVDWDVDTDFKNKIDIENDSFVWLFEEKKLNIFTKNKIYHVNFNKLSFFKFIVFEDYLLLKDESIELELSIVYKNKEDKDIFIKKLKKILNGKNIFIEN